MLLSFESIAISTGSRQRFSSELNPETVVCWRSVMRVTFSYALRVVMRITPLAPREP